MKYYLIIIFTFISFNLIAEENPIQQIDKESFCKAVIQEEEKTECYQIKKYIDQLEDTWFGIYTEQNVKQGYSYTLQNIISIDGKYYFKYDYKDIYIGNFEGGWSETFSSNEFLFQAHHPFNLVKTETISGDLSYLGEVKDNNIIISKKDKDEESIVTIEGLDFNLYDFLDGPWNIERKWKVGDEYNSKMLYLSNIDENLDIVENIKYKFQGVENRIINGETTEVIVVDWFYGDGKKYCEELYDEKFNTLLAHYYYDDSWNEIHIQAAEEIARQIEYGEYVYIGEHQEGLPEGKGKMDYGDGNQYEGEFHKGQMHGKGTYDFFNGAKYEGEWMNGLYEGYGKFYYTDGGSYEGEWKNADKHGYGKQIAVEGDIYEGEWFEDKRQGSGKYVYANGDVYEGEFLQNTFHGQGKLTYANGDVYEGQWENNKFISN